MLLFRLPILDSTLRVGLGKRIYRFNVDIYHIEYAFPISWSQLKLFQIISVGSHKFSTDERYSVVFDHINRDEKLSQNFKRANFFVKLFELKYYMNVTTIS